MLQEKLEQVEARIAAAAARAGRERSDIQLVAVTKKFPASVIRDAYAAGLREFGENYVQEFEVKRGELGDCRGARFHLIGHLQSNKSRKAAEIFDVIQTVDSAKLARRLNDDLPAGRPALDVLIEVKLSDEAAKAGAAPEEIPALVEAIHACPRLRLLGLMTMPPWPEVAEQSRPYFIRLRKLAEQNRLPQLSMGMSQDFEVAIEEGATIVRIGTALFGPRKQA